MEPERFLDVINLLEPLEDGAQEIKDRLTAVAVRTGVELYSPKKDDGLNGLIMHTLRDVKLIDDGYGIIPYRRQEYRDRMYEMEFQRTCAECAWLTSFLLDNLSPETVVDILTGEASGADVAIPETLRIGSRDVIERAIDLYAACGETDALLRTEEPDPRLVSAHMLAVTGRFTCAGLVAAVNAGDIFKERMAVTDGKRFSYRYIQKKKFPPSFIYQKDEVEAEFALGGNESLSVQERTGFMHPEQAYESYRDAEYRKHSPTDCLNAVTGTDAFMKGRSGDVLTICEAMNMSKADELFVLMTCAGNMTAEKGFIEIRDRGRRDEILQKVIPLAKKPVLAEKILKAYKKRFRDEHSSLLGIKREDVIESYRDESILGFVAEPEESKNTVLHYEDRLIGFFEGEKDKVSLVAETHGYT